MLKNLYINIVSFATTTKLPDDFWKDVIIGTVAGLVSTLIICLLRKRHRKKHVNTN